MPDAGGITGRQPKAISNALAVLEAVALAGSGVTAKQIAAQLGMPPATVYRLVNILVAEEYLVRLPELSGFSLGRRIDAFVDAALVPPVVRSARDLLGELRLSVRVGIHLVAYRGGVVRYLDVDPDFPPPLPEPALNAALPRTALGALVRTPGGPGTVHRTDDPQPGWDSLVVGIRDDDGLVHAALWLVGTPAALGVVTDRLGALERRAQDLDPLLR